MLLARMMLLSSAMLAAIVWMVTAAMQPEATSPPASDAQQEQCADCHAEVADPYKQHAHAGLRCSQCHPNALAHQNAEDPTELLPVVDFRAETCGSCHKFQYETYMTSEPGTAGEFGGTPADPKEHPKTKDFPLYNKIVAGHGFTKEYNEDRAHRYILRDHIDIARGKNLACLNCKSTQVAYYWGKEWKGVELTLDGDPVAKWQEAIQRIPKEMQDYGVSCVHCHNPHTAQLHIINKGLISAIERRGVNPYWKERNAPSFARADKQQKEILLCAQCHVEYVCGPGVDKKVRLDYPWRKARDLHDYYMERHKYQQDWVHELLGEPLVKSQHPETETFWESKYERAGASCVTCHMPKVNVNGRWLTSHWLVSPLRYIDKYMKGEKLGAYPCAQCHTVSPRQLREQVLRVQRHVNEAQGRVQQALSDSIDAITAAKQAKAEGKSIDEEQLQKAIRLHQLAHVRWENLVVSENSMGFHNPEEVLKELTEAMDYARQAQLLATRAMK
ncbi:MAG: ammonia-forming cytochrome c nitrite reductase subunit c552 [Armatimonadota bacterium]|nr:ammonia-forming cytochrome c nitrite reductase subunit c552 [Armatimonadota bacterium]